MLPSMTDSYRTGTISNQKEPFLLKAAFGGGALSQQQKHNENSENGLYPIYLLTPSPLHTHTCAYTQPPFILSQTTIIRAHSYTTTDHHLGCHVMWPDDSTLTTECGQMWHMSTPHLTLDKTTRSPKWSYIYVGGKSTSILWELLFWIAPSCSP